MSEITYPRLQATKKMRRLVARTFIEPRYFKLGRPVAWITSGAPAEILLAMGIIPLYPENYAALCGASHVGGSLCQAAEECGFSRDLCSYARAHIGSMIQPEKAPQGGLPRPDLLVACSNICGTVFKWYQELARRLNVPLLVLDTPFIYGEEPTPEEIAFVRDQLKDMITDLELLTGRRLQEKKLQQVAQYANETTRLWTEIRRLCAHSPSPLTAADLFVHMAPIVVMRGRKQAVDYYRQLKQEVEERINTGVAAVPGERKRLLWDNIAIWHRLYRFFAPFSQAGAVFVTDTYTGNWSMDVSMEGDILEGLALSYTNIFLNTGMENRRRKMLQMIEEFQVDGVVFHSNRSCKPYSVIQYLLADAIRNDTGKPCLIIEADMADPRNYAEQAVVTRIEAFLEQLG